MTAHAFTHDESITIYRPVHEVFEFLADFPRMPSWQPEFAEMTPISDGAPRAGYRYRYTRRLPVGTQRGTMEITTYEPDQQLGWRALPGSVLPRGSWTFTPLDDGRATRVDEHFTAQVQGPLRLLTPLLRRQFRRDVGKDLQTAKRILETADTPAPHPAGPTDRPAHP